MKEKEKEAKRRKLAELREAFGEEEMLEVESDEEEEEEEEPLPPIFIPPIPSPILCGFYSEPGKFWVSLVSKNSKTSPQPLASPVDGHCFHHIRSRVC